MRRLGPPDKPTSQNRDVGHPEWRRVRCGPPAAQSGGALRLREGHPPEMWATRHPSPELGIELKCQYLTTGHATGREGLVDSRFGFHSGLLWTKRTKARRRSGLGEPKLLRRRLIPGSGKQS